MHRIAELGYDWLMLVLVVQLLVLLLPPIMIYRQHRKRGDRSRAQWLWYLRIYKALILVTATLVAWFICYRIVLPSVFSWFDWLLLGVATAVFVGVSVYYPIGRRTVWRMPDDGSPPLGPPS